MRVDEGIDGFAALLGKAGLELGAEEMADVLWLAGHISPGVRENISKGEDTEEESAEPTVREEFLDTEPEEDEDDAQFPLSLPQKQDGSKGGDGIPIKAPAAPALRIRLELARALRPLRRRVPSPVRMEFDQAATIDRIADQGIWSPVLSPAPERWLDVALVIEESKSAPLWKETLTEFQTLLERQGAFRNVISWRLRSDDMGELTLLSRKSSRPRSAGELLDSTERRLILVVSDCTSLAWQRGTIYPWLETWGEQAPMTVIQLLPERLWAQTGLAHGLPMWLSSFAPGVPSARMMAKAQMPLWDLFEAEQEQVTVPVVSLEAEPLKQWASVVTGAGESRTVGFRFEKRELTLSEVEGEEQPELSAEEKVQLFRATASLTAQKLAGLMAAVPVSPQIVNLIRQTILSEAEPVHVAEVYMGGLMKVRPEEEYDFLPEVRNALLDGISITTTEQVLDVVSDYVSKRLNLNTRSFEALLSFNLSNNAEAQEMVVPFARVATQVLRRMGQEYMVIADRIKIRQRVVMPTFLTEPVNWVPLFQTFRFREAVILPVAEVDEPITANQLGRVWFKNAFWQARLQEEKDDVVLHSGSKVTVMGRDGLTLLVKSISSEKNTDDFADEIQRYNLTRREAEIWKLYKHGSSFQEISQELFVTLNTVKKHIKNIRAKHQDFSLLKDASRREIRLVAKTCINSVKLDEFLLDEGISPGEIGIGGNSFNDRLTNVLHFIASEGILENFASWLSYEMHSCVKHQLEVLRGGEPIEKAREDIIKPAVFVSYSAKDIETAKLIIEFLAKECSHLEIFNNVREIKPGESLLKLTNEGLGNASYVLVLFSESSLNSKWVTREWAAALAAQATTLIPILIEPDTLPPPLLRDRVYLDMSNDIQVGLKRLKTFFEDELIAANRI